MLRPDPIAKKQFLKLLKKRYEEEFSGLKLWKGHQEWWLEDIGINHEIKILDFLKSVSRVRNSNTWQNQLCIDLGCGSGSALIAAKAMGANVVGLELEMAGSDLKLARSRASLYGHKLSLVNANATDAPFKEEQFDVVLSLSVVEHVQDVEAYIFEAFRILKSGGILVLSTDNRLSIKEGHTGLYMMHWLPKEMFTRIANYKLGRLPNSELSVWPRTYSHYRKLTKKAGFRLVANRWDLFLSKKESNSQRWKRFIATICKKSHFPLEEVLPGTTLVLKK